MTFISISGLGRLRGFFQSCSLETPVWATETPVWAAGCCSLTPELPFPKVWTLMWPVHSASEVRRVLRWSLSQPPAPRGAAVRWDQAARSFIWDLGNLQEEQPVSLLHCSLAEKPFPYTQISASHALIHTHGFSSSTEKPGAWLHLPSVPKWSVLKLSKDENAAILIEFSYSNWKRVIKILKHISCVQGKWRLSN